MVRTKRAWLGQQIVCELDYFVGGAPVEDVEVRFDEAGIVDGLAPLAERAEAVARQVGVVQRDRVGEVLVEPEP